MLGCKDLTVATDHKPLLNILNDRSLADIQNRRLQNLKEKTLSYQFKIAHVPGRQHLGPDAASRYPVGDPERLMLPGEPPETDLGASPVTSDLRAIIVAGLCNNIIKLFIYNKVVRQIYTMLTTIQLTVGPAENFSDYNPQLTLLLVFS